MSESESQGGAGRREVAWRLFASEFDDSDFSYSESDEERAPNYVITPTGARVNRLFVVGVLTEIETVSEDYLRARIVDPTGPFVIYAGQYQPDALAFLEEAQPPMFVAVTGKARTYQPDDSDQVFTSIRPESMSEVEAATRDRWVVQTAEQTVNRVARMAEAKQTGLAGDDLRATLEANGVDEGLAAGIPLALEHYGTTGDYLSAMRELALDTARVVSGEIDEAESITVRPGQGDDDAIAGLVERVLDTDVVETGADEAAEGEATAPTADTDEVVAEAGAGDGSAIGTAESTSETGETEDTDETGSTETVAEVDQPSGSDEETTEAQTTDDPQATDSPDDPGGTEASTDEPVESTTSEASESDEPASGTDESEPEADAEPLDATSDTGGATEEFAEGAEESAELDDSDDLGDSDDSEDLDDFEPEFDLDDDEREELEEEFGTEFQSGSEVSEPGEADIDMPETEPADEADEMADGTAEATGAEPSTDIDTVAETEPTSEAESVAESAEPSEPEPSDDDDDVAETEPAEDTAEQSSASPPSSLEDVDLEDAVMDVMADLDEGDGAGRDEVLAAVVDRTGADPDAVDDAIQDALMGGRCYEPDDETLKPI